MSIKEKRMLNMQTGEDEGMILEGYAVVFDSPATHGFTEIISREAFNNCDFSDCVLRYNHNDTQFSLARTRNKSLELIVDNHGLKIKAHLIDTQNNRDVYAMVKSGLLDKMSFSFTVAREEWDNETETRTILEIDKLYDVSVVDVPFYETTEVYARSLDEYKENFASKKKFEFEKEKLKLMLDL